MTSSVCDGPGRGRQAAPWVRHLVLVGAAAACSAGERSTGQ